MLLAVSYPAAREVCLPTGSHPGPPCVKGGTVSDHRHGLFDSPKKASHGVF